MKRAAHRMRDGNRRAGLRGARAVPIALAIAAAVAAVVLAALPLANGYFLADDFSQLATFWHWDSRGTLLRHTLGKFAASIDGVNGFYRPLTYLTYAANFAIDGAHARPWLAVNIALHAANAALCAVLVLMLAGDRSRARWLGALAAAAFFAMFSPSWEVTLWVSCRYDSLATFFTLLAAAGFLRGRMLAALVATSGALLAKESGAVAFVFIGLLALAQSLESAGGTPSLRARELLRRLAPWILLGAAYTALRIAFFGSAIHVYRAVNVDFLSVAHWRTMLSTGVAWAHVQFPGRFAFRPLAVTTLLVIICGLVLAGRRSRPARVRHLAVLASLASAGALLLPHMNEFDTAGIGGRLFYQAAALYAVLLGLAMHEAALALPRQPGVAATVLALGGALLLANTAWGWNAACEYLRVQHSMSELARAIGALDGTIRPADYFLVYVPDRMGRVPFGRNAQAGLMLPPVQQRPVSGHLLVQTDAEFDVIERQIDAGVISVLRTRPLFELLEGRTTSSLTRVEPTGALCWNAARAQLVRMPVVPGGPGTLGARLAQAYSAAGCRTLPMRR